VLTLLNVQDPIRRIANRSGKLEYVQRAFSATTDAGPDELFDVVSDITTYPEWLDLVAEVEPSNEPEAWLVTLRARVGPFARSKRLRMVRVEHQASIDGGPATVRFERQEVDGRDHSDWVLAARVEAPADHTDGRSTTDRSAGKPSTSTVWLDLNYDGAMWSGLLDGVLGAAADRAVSSLQEYMANRHSHPQS
jgi:hypothetical protein